MNTNRLRSRLIAPAAALALGLGACGQGAQEQVARSPGSQAATTSASAATLAYGDPIEQGQRYAYALDLHCGMDFLGEFDGRGWKLTQAPAGPTPETGAGEGIPEDWPSIEGEVVGVITLVAPERVEYSLPDKTVIGVYEPIPAKDLPSCA